MSGIRLAQSPPPHYLLQPFPVGPSTLGAAFPEMAAAVAAAGGGAGGATGTTTAARAAATASPKDDKGAKRAAPRNPVMAKKSRGSSSAADACLATGLSAPPAAAQHRVRQGAQALHDGALDKSTLELWGRYHGEYRFLPYYNICREFSNFWPMCQGILRHAGRRHTFGCCYARR